MIPDTQELIGEADPEIAALIAKCERVKKLTDFYLSKVGEEEGQYQRSTWRSDKDVNIC